MSSLIIWPLINFDFVEYASFQVAKFHLFSGKVDRRAKVDYGYYGKPLTANCSLPFPGINVMI